MLIGSQGPPPGTQAAISSVSIAELHFGLLVARDDESRARRAQRLGVVESKSFRFRVGSVVSCTRAVAAMARSALVQELVERACGTGLDVRLSLEGDQTLLPTAALRSSFLVVRPFAVKTTDR